jgi:hypothetical protein
MYQINLSSSPLTPMRPTYSAEMMTMSFNGGSLPSTSGSRHGRMNHGRLNLGSAPDLTSSPVTNVWTNPLNESQAFSRGRTLTGEPTKRYSPIVSSNLSPRHFVERHLADLATHR